jgi:hypothetical protein
MSSLEICPLESGVGLMTLANGRPFITPKSLHFQ